MELFPYALVLFSTLTHAYWNFLIKKYADNKDIFIGLAKVSEVLMYFIPFLVFVDTQNITADISHLYIIAIAATFVFSNYLCLTKSYKIADLSIAYPVSRSTGLFLPILAYFLIGERIDVVGIIAIVLISIGVLIIPMKSFRRHHLEDIFSKLKNKGIIFALLAAFTAACSILWDKVVLHHFHPFTYMYLYTSTVTIFYLPILLKFKFSLIKKEWRDNHWSILQVGFLNTFTYVLVLFALMSSKASYVGSVRQLSLVMAAFLGWKFLHEKFSYLKVTGIILILLGGVMISFAQ